jgi:hypothetical protein
MSDVIATPVLWQSPLQLLIADHQRRGIDVLDARDSLGGLPGLIDCILTGYRPCQRDNTVRCRNLDIAIGRSRRNLRLHESRDLTV